MSCVRLLRAAPLLFVGVFARAAPAQQPPANIQPYRAPSIALVLPAPSSAPLPVVIADQPSVVFRFTVGEPSDPVDASTLRVWLDGSDRSALFKVESRADGGDAWGRLATGNTQLPLGTHLVSARVCTTRGLCAMTHAAVAVMPAMTTQPASAVSAARQIPELLNLLDSARKIVRP